MNSARLVGSVLGIVVSFPITLYLSWRIMHAVDATAVMWLLWWINVPILLLVRVLTEVVAQDK
jgi:hypothetical protein